MTTPVWAKALVVLLLAAFVGLGSLWISRPGLQYDETLFVLASYPRDDTPIACTLHFGGRPVALMIISYLGALKGWLYQPIVQVWSGSAALVRFPALLIGATSLGFLYLFTRRAFGWPAALAALALAATDPIYLFSTRLDWGPVAIQRLCLLAGCFGVLRWWQKKRARDLGLGFFVMGVGVFDKATFLWLLAALALSTVIVFPRALWRSLRPAPLAVATAGLLLGAGPFLYYNWKWPGEIFRPNVGRADNYGEKLRSIQFLIEGTALVGWISRDMDGPPLPPRDPMARAVYAIAPHEPLAETLLLPAATLALFLLPVLPFTPWGRGMLFALLFCLFAFAQMLPIRHAGAVHHLALCLPFPHVFVAAGLVGAREGLRAWLIRGTWRRIATVVLWALVLALLGANLRVVAHHYFRILGYGGGIGWSEAIYSLEQSLQRSQAERILLLDWGMSTQLRLLSGDRLPLEEAAHPQGPSYDASYMEGDLPNPRVLYVRHAAGEPAAFPQIAEAFQKLVALRGQRSEVVETIRDGRGRPIYEVLAVQPR